jgi:hypothetical protein
VVRVLFIVIALLLIIAGVVGGLYYWGVDPLAKLGITPPAAQKDEPPPPPPPPSYVDFGLLIIPVIQDHEVKKQAEMIVRLEVAATDKELIGRNLPRLQNAFLEDMIPYLGNALRDGRPLDLQAIRARLLATGNRTLGAPYLRDVLVENPSLK